MLTARSPTWSRLGRRACADLLASSGFASPFRSPCARPQVAPDLLPAYALRGADATLTPEHAALITENWKAVMAGASPARAPRPRFARAAATAARASQRRARRR